MEEFDQINGRFYENVLRTLKCAADQVAELEQTETAEGGRCCIGD